MPNISDMIEDFLMQTLGTESSIDISRNDLANFFNVSPSQINYVLTTRFNFERGFIIESKRGGGGYISISRVSTDDNDWIREIINTKLDTEIDYRSACYLIDELEKVGLMQPGEASVLKSVVSPQALGNPMKIENHLRANIIKKVLMDLTKENSKT